MNYRVTVSVVVISPEAAETALADLVTKLRDSIAGLPVDGALNVSVYPDVDLEEQAQTDALTAAQA